MFDRTTFECCFITKLVIRNNKLFNTRNNRTTYLSNVTTIFAEPFFTYTGKNAQQANKWDNYENKYVNKVSDEYQSD